MYISILRIFIIIIIIMITCDLDHIIVNSYDLQVNYRSRLVARQVRKKGIESIFAPTPPLEALRSVLGLAATNIEGQWQVE